MHPYFQMIIDAYAAAQRPFFHQVTPGVARDMMSASISAAPKPTDLPVMASVNNENVQGPNGAIAIRRYLPEGGILGTCVYAHSGGWVIGDLESGDNLCRRLAGLASVEVISVDYRLAPEYPFPVPLDDVYAVVQWASGLGRPLIVAGESAGANLVAAAAIRARDEKGPAIIAQLLASPVTDHNFETESYRTIGDKNWLLSRADMEWFWGHYCAESDARNNPLVSPLRLKNASGLPQAMVVVSELDPLRDEGLAYAELLRTSGVPVSVIEGKDMLHAYFFAAGAIPEVAQSVADSASWLKNCILASNGVNNQ
ncbi:alpha/beta hydrolase [Zhongshania sp.]|uniref:alpha/beta hydrolase n=1 Tax=Zhongshania sp. TaxID=1971902 RepID=UPI0035637A52